MSDWRRVIDQVVGPGPCWCRDRAVHRTAPEVETLFSLSLSTERKQSRTLSLSTPHWSGLQEADNWLHQNLNRQFQAALPFLLRPGTLTMARAERERERQRGKEGERECTRLRQMPYSSHRGYFVTSKWLFGSYRPRMLMCHRSWYHHQRRAFWTQPAAASLTVQPDPTHWFAQLVTSCCIFSWNKSCVSPIWRWSAEVEAGRPLSSLVGRQE